MVSRDFNLLLRAGVLRRRAAAFASMVVESFRGDSCCCVSVCKWVFDVVVPSLARFPVFLLEP